MAQEVFVIEFPLKVEKWQADILDKRYEHLRRIYNYAQGKLVRQYTYLIQMNEYRKYGFSKEHEKMLAKKGNEKALKAIKDIREHFFRNHPFHISGIYDKAGEPLDITFSSRGIPGFLEKIASRNIGAETTYIDLGINSLILGMLGNQLWAAWDRMINDPETRRVSFKKYGELNSFATRVKITRGKKYSSGMNLHLDTMTLDVKINGKTGKNAKFISLPIVYNLKHADYEMNALHGGMESIKVVKVLRRLVRGQYKYYLQLTIEGEKPQKGRQLGKGTVGIDIGPTTIAVAGENIVSLDKLAAECDSYQNEINKLARKIDRSRRANNPQNFNEDGTIKRGVRLVWKKRKDMKRYSDLLNELAELKRRQAAVRKASHISRANALLKQGDTFIVEDNPYKGWAARAKETKVSERTGKIQRKKRWGKSVADHAPAMFVTVLENKVKSLGGVFIKVDPKNAASRYDFTDGSFTKHELDERSITLSNDDTHQRDLLAAFNLRHLKSGTEETKQYDMEAMRQHYDRFCELENEEMARYWLGIKKDDQSTIGARIFHTTTKK